MHNYTVTCWVTTSSYNLTADFNDYDAAIHFAQYFERAANFKYVEVVDNNVPQANKGERLKYVKTPSSIAA